jgi:hypothetical protein
METTTPFDLNCAIQRWRENLTQSPALRSENLNELESHLRDSIATLQTRGLSSEEAFTVAAKRIGTGGLLAKEFAKVNAGAVWMDRLLWMLIGHQAWMLISMLCSTASSITGGAVSQRIVQRHEMDFFAYSLNLINAFLTPLVLILITLIAWKVLLKSDGKARGFMTHWLAEPIWLAVMLFVLCLSLQLLTSYSLRSFLNGPWYWWQFSMLQDLRQLPEYVIGVMLIVVVARKRLRLGNA